MAKNSVVIRHEFGEHESPGVDCRFDPITGEELEVLTHVKQSAKDECDINRIMARFEATGQLPEMIAREPRYGDFSDVPSFQASLEIVAKAEEQFAALPAAVRDRFGHDPAKMLEFCADKRNADEMVRLGLALPRKPQAPQGGSPSPAQPTAPAEASAPKA